MNEIDSRCHEDEINLLDLVKVVLKHKKLVLGFVFGISLLTVIVSLLMTKIYESRAVIAPVQQSAAQSSLIAVAAQFGMVAPQGSNTAEIISILKSDILMQKILEKQQLQDTLLGKSDIKGKSENEKTWRGIRMLRDGILKITENRKDNIITILAQYEDPVIAQKIAAATLDELVDHMTGEAKRVADANRKYLEAQITTTADPFIRQKIYSLIAQQIETATMAEAKENFAFKVIDPPRVPDKRIEPKRREMVLISLIVSLFVGVFLAFAKEYFEKNRELWHELIKMSGLKMFHGKTKR